MGRRWRESAGWRERTHAGSRVQSKNLTRSRGTMASGGNPGTYRRSLSGRTVTPSTSSGPARESELGRVGRAGRVGQVHQVARVGRVGQVGRVVAAGRYRHPISRLCSAATPRAAERDRDRRVLHRFNDPSDLEQLHTRSDHYSYAAKGVPIIFFTTACIPTTTRTPTRCRRPSSTR